MSHFEFEKEEATASLLLEDGKRITVKFLENSIEIIPDEDVQLQVEELPGKLIIDVY